jgi:hypothetical protein
MTGFYVPREARTREIVGAVAVAVSVGGLSLYLARMLLARDHMESKAPPREPGRRQRAESEGAK